MSMMQATMFINEKICYNSNILDTLRKFYIIMKKTEVQNKQNKVDQKALAEIMNTYQGRLFNVVNKIVADEDAANDIVQDVFITFYEKGETFESRSSIYTWLYRIATNKSIDHVRKITRERKNQKKLHHLDNVTAKSHDENIHHKMIVGNALKELDETFRTPLMLAEYENMSYAEIAEELGIEVNTVRTRIFRARKKLLSILEKYGVEL